MPPITSSINNMTTIERYKRLFKIKYQHYLDASVPFPVHRWIFLVFVLLLFLARIVYAQGYYLITYVAAVQSLVFLLPLLTPLTDPDEIRSTDSSLPSTQSDNEFRPFLSAQTEFVVWRNITYTFVICLALTIFPFLDIPVFWPILFIYFCVIFTIQMWKRVLHMIRYRYVPWTRGKPRFVPKNNVESAEQVIK